MNWTGFSWRHCVYPCGLEQVGAHATLCCLYIFVWYTNYIVSSGGGRGVCSWCGFRLAAEITTWWAVQVLLDGSHWLWHCCLLWHRSDSGGCEALQDDRMSQGGVEGVCRNVSLLVHAGFENLTSCRLVWVDLGECLSHAVRGQKEHLIIWCFRVFPHCLGSLGLKLSIESESGIEALVSQTSPAHPTIKTTVCFFNAVIENLSILPCLAWTGTSSYALWNKGHF